ncbi:MAG: adenylate/guanylate cyclase domain-containing protein [Chloroflexota bacterium]
MRAILNIQSSIHTDAGRTHDVNEDWHGALTPADLPTSAEPCWLWVVADGVGSYGTGKEASEHAGPEIIRSFKELGSTELGERLRTGIQKANRILWERRRAYVQQGQDRPVLTTALCAVILGDKLWLANVGDCRAYLVRKESINQLTIDHTWVNEQVAKGRMLAEAARNHRQSHMLSRSLGNGRTVEADIFDYQLEPADTIVLCSDGLTRYLTDDEIRQMSVQGTVESATRRMIDEANARGGADNTTVAVIRVVAPKADPAPPVVPPEIESSASRERPAQADELAETSRAKSAGLRSIVNMISSSLDVQATLDSVMETVVQLTGGSRGYIMLLDEESGQLRFSIGRKIRADSGQAPQFSRHIAHDVFESGKPLLLSDAQSKGPYRTIDSVKIANVRSLMCAPLQCAAKRIGIVYVENQLSADMFSQDDLDLLCAFANHAAVALEHARLYAGVQTQMNELAAMRVNHENVLRSITSAIISTDTDGRVQIVNHAAEQLFGITAQESRGAALATLLPRALRGTLSALAAEVAKDQEVESEVLQMDVELPGRGKAKLGVRGIPVLDSEKHAVGSMLVIDDLTQERLLAEAWQTAATERERVKSTFGRFLAPSIMEHLGDQGQALQLGGARREITVLFADLRGFTSISERFSPEEVVSILNSYLACTTDIILNHGGTLDKFLGDGVLALFNAPLDQEQHALAAVQVAMEIQSRIRSLAPAGGPRITCGIGVVTGEAIVGTIGTQELMNYTAIGDVVNLASRLQSEARGGEVLLAESTYRHVEEYVEAEELGLVHVKGRSEPVCVFKVSRLNAP